MKKISDLGLEVQYGDLLFIKNNSHIAGNAPKQIEYYLPDRDDDISEFILIDDKELISFINNMKFMLNYEVYENLSIDELIKIKEQFNRDAEYYEDALDRLADSMSYHVAEMRYPEYVFNKYKAQQIDNLIKNKKSTYTLQLSN